MADLEANVIKPLKKIVGLQLRKVIYKDACPQSDLTMSKEGFIHVLDHELQLKFNDSVDLFISWDTVKGWRQFTLGARNHSFLAAEAQVNLYEMTDSERWKEIVGKELVGFKVFGHSEYEMKTREVDGADKEKLFVYENQPHVFELIFENNVSFFSANFHFEENFEPVAEIGDDIWVIFDSEIATRFINKFYFTTLHKK